MGVTLSAIMREQGPELAMLGLVCRVIEGMAGEGMTLAWMTPSPMFGFEVALALWFTARGMNAPPAAPLLNG
jgi:hypothetical protein